MLRCIRSKRLVGSSSYVSYCWTGHCGFGCRVSMLLFVVPGRSFFGRLNAKDHYVIVCVCSNCYCMALPYNLLALMSFQTRMMFE